MANQIVCRTESNCRKPSFRRGRPGLHDTNHEKPWIRIIRSQMNYVRNEKLVVIEH